MTDQVKSLTADQILQSQDMQCTLVPVPEWGGQVYVGMMTGEERDEWEQMCAGTRGKDKKSNIKNLRAHLAVFTVQDETGAKLFNLTQVQALGKKSCAALDRIFDAAAKLNRLRPEDVEELVKN